MIHYLYKTINMLNNKIYIGVHSTDNLDDEYMGSGYALKNAITKYGKDNFIKDILYRFNNRESAFICESIIVDESFISKNNNYNLKVGGDSGPSLFGKDNPMYGRKHLESSKKLMSEFRQGKYSGENHPMYGKKHSEESKNRMSVSLKGKRTKDANHNYGNSLSNETKRKLRNSLIGKKRDNKSGFANITWEESRSKWGVRLTIYGKTKFIGRYLELEDAILERNKAYKLYYND